MPMPPTNLLVAFAYILLVIATLPTVAEYSGWSVGLFAVWLTLVGYSAAILKAASSSEETSRRFDGVAWLAWLAYYTLSAVWQLPLHWYDSLAMTALFIPKTFLNYVLMAIYYAFGAASYMGHADVMQVTGRMILMIIMGQAALQAYGHKETNEK